MQFNQRDLRAILMDAAGVDTDELDKYKLTIYHYSSEEERPLLDGCVINILRNADSIDEYGNNNVVYVPIEKTALDV